MRMLGLFFAFFASVALAQPPPIQTLPLSVDPTPHIVHPTNATSGIITDAMSAMTVKPWCRLVSNVNIAALSGTLSVDTTATNVGDVVLLVAQTTGSQNGPWVVASGAWSRPDWYASGHTTQTKLNIAVQIRIGSQFPGTWWRISAPTSGTITIDTTSTTWAQTAKISTAAINSQSVTYATIQNLVGLSVFGRSANSTGVGGEITGTDGQYLRVAGTTLGFGPFPTPTPFPSITPYPSATTYPSVTPFPSATIYPSVTPFPSATPYPTPTPHIVTLTGDVTGTGTGIPADTFSATIASAAVTYPKIQNVAGLSVFGRSANTSGVGGNITGTNGQYLQISGNVLSFTPFPTPTPFPSITPYPSATIYPSVTPFPSATVYPSVTPFPSATPYPTSTPHIVTLTGDVTGAGSGAFVDTFATTIGTGVVTDAMSALSNKPWVRLAALTQTTLSGTQTCDGSGTGAGDLVLAVAQTDGKENGPWIASASAWTRPAWYASGHTTQAFTNISVHVRVGSSMPGTWWRITAPTGAITIDTTPTTWSQTAIISTAAIVNQGITFPKIQNLVGLSVFGRSANSTGVGGEITGTDGQYLRVQGSTLAFGPFPTSTPFPSITPYPSATIYPTPTPITNVATANAFSTPLPDHRVLLGNGTGFPGSVATPGLLGYVLTSTGSSTDPIFQAIPTPTITPYPSATVYPSVTPFPSATPYPTPTPHIITLTGDVTGAGSGASADTFAATIATDAVTTSKILNSNVTLPKIENIPDGNILGNNSGGFGPPLALNSGLARLLLGVPPNTRTIDTTAPLAGGGDLSADRTLSIVDAVANGVTKGAATFSGTDFNSASPGVITIDYTNGQTASALLKGFLSAADWSTFNGKGNGTVTSFTAGTLSPLFTTSVGTSTTTPSLSFTLSTAAANTFFGNGTGSTAAPTFMTASTARTALALVPGTDVFTQRTMTGTSNEIAVVNGNGVSGNPTFSLPSALTFTGKTVTGGTYTAVNTFQIGTNGTSPQPLFALTPNNQPAQWFSARLFDDTHYAQFAFKNAADGQRAFFGFIGSGFSNALRQNNFEIGTASGSRIAFRAGDGDQQQILIDEISNIRLKNTSPGSGCQGCIVFGNSGVPTTSPTNTGQLYNDNGTLKWRGSAGTVTAIANP